MSSDHNKIQLAEAKLKEAIRYASNSATMSPFEQQEITRNILKAQIEYNNARAEAGYISKQHAERINAEISYQLKLFENNNLRQGNVPSSIVMAHLYEAQMEYLEKIKQMYTEDSSSYNSSDIGNLNNNLNDWRETLIPQATA